MGRSQRHKVRRDGTDVTDSTYSEGSMREGVGFPTISSLSPNTIAHGAGNATVTVNGTGFVNHGSKINYGGVDLATTFVSATQLTATFPHSTAVAGTKVIKVRNGSEFSSAGTNFTYS